MKLRKESREKGQEEGRFSKDKGKDAPREEGIMIKNIKEDHNKHPLWLSTSLLGILNKSTGRSFETDILIYYL